MIMVVVVLAVVAVAAIVVALVTASRLGTQRKLTSAAEELATRRADDLTSTAAALEQEAAARAAAQDLAAVETARAADAETAAEQAADARRLAEAQVRAAEQRTAEFAAARAATSDGGIDPHLLWSLEQARSERTWRHSVAPGPDSISVFADASDPLLEALQVELDAAREEVGAVVELEVDLPPGVSAAGSVLALRAAQELLAAVIRRGEVTTLHVHADGHDLIVAVRSVDEDGDAVATDPLAIPVSADIEPIEDGVRIRDAVRPPDGPPADDEPAGDETPEGEPPA